MDYSFSFGEKLRVWRVTNKLSQDKVADLLNCSRRTIISWERNEKLPGYDSIIAVAKMMKVSTDWLLGIIS